MGCAVIRSAARSARPMALRFDGHRFAQPPTDATWIRPQAGDVCRHHNTEQVQPKPPSKTQLNGDHLPSHHMPLYPRSCAVLSMWQPALRPCLPMCTQRIWQLSSMSGPPSNSATLWSSSKPLGKRVSRPHPAQYGLAVHMRSRLSCSLRPVIRVDGATLAVATLTIARAGLSILSLAMAAPTYWSAPSPYRAGERKYRCLDHRYRTYRTPKRNAPLNRETQAGRESLLVEAVETSGAWLGFEPRDSRGLATEPPESLYRRHRLTTPAPCKNNKAPLMARLRKLGTQLSCRYCRGSCRSFQQLDVALSKNRAQTLPVLQQG